MARLRPWLGVALIASALAQVTPATGSWPHDPIHISEIRVHEPGPDDDEYFELAGPPGASIDGLTYIVIGNGPGGSGCIEGVVDMTGCAIPDSGRFVVAQTGFTLGAADQTANLNFENDDNVTHLLVSGFTAHHDVDLDSNDDGILDSRPWDALLDLIALIEEENPPTSTVYHYGPPTVGPDGTTIPGHVYRCVDGWHMGNVDVAAGMDTPGQANPCEMATAGFSVYLPLLSGRPGGPSVSR